VSETPTHNLLTVRDGRVPANSSADCLLSRTTWKDSGHSNRRSLADQGALAQQWEVIPNLTLTAGGRYDHYEYAGDAFTYRFTGAYYFTPTSTKLRGSYGTAFKAPNLFNTYSTSPFALGNPNLKPEKSQGFDIGIDRKGRATTDRLSA
jgi:vitamin B12 transporter